MPDYQVPRVGRIVSHPQPPEASAPEAIGKDGFNTVPKASRILPWISLELSLPQITRNPFWSES